MIKLIFNQNWLYLIWIYKKLWKYNLMIYFKTKRNNNYEINLLSLLLLFNSSKIAYSPMWRIGCFFYYVYRNNAWNIFKITLQEAKQLVPAYRPRLRDSLGWTHERWIDWNKLNILIRMLHVVLPITRSKSRFSFL